MSSITGDPPVMNCPKTNQRKTADSNGGATVTWPEVTSSTGNNVEINNDDYRPGNNFPVGFTKVVYTITNAAGAKSFCIFYVVVEGMLSTLFLVSV